MVFTETIMPSGKILYKGLGKLSCHMVLRDTRFFYLTENPRQAKNYGTPCAYRAKKTLRLFDLTHANIDKLLKSHYPVKPETHQLLRLVLGTGITIGEQVRAVKAIFGPKNAKSISPGKFKQRGQRLSYTDMNKVVFGSLAREFLIPEGYDGYYAPRKKSIFHGGTFHSEIMLNNAYQTVERASGRAPVVSGRSLHWAIPRLFADFCKGTTRLIRPYGGGLTIFCTGGMGVKLYLESRGQTLPPKIRRTSDYDFTFAVARDLRSDRQLASYVFSMRKIMMAHLNAFVRWLNREYTGANARLLVSTHNGARYDNPRLQVPGTNRKVYQVISYKIVTGRGDVTDLVDTALAVYPGSSRAMLHLPFSYKLGIPVQRLRYQLKDTLALLSGSFIHKGMISKRNPITGSAKNKGQKNTERAARLLRLVAARKKYYKNLAPLARKALPLIENVLRQNASAARSHARNVNKALKKIK